MQFLGATIIAGAIYFVLSLFSGLYLDGVQKTVVAAVLEAFIKTTVFTILFHYLHNWVAKLLGWYRIDRPDDAHRFDRTPALDQVREEQRS